MNSFDPNNRNCGSIQESLSDYLNNALSARQMVAVERHLSACADCAAEAKRWEQTVQLLRSAEHRDTGNDFMAKLHARLDTVEPEPLQSSSVWSGWRETLQGLWEGVQARRAPAMALGLAVVVLVSVVTLRRPHPVETAVPGTPPVFAIEAETLQRHVALAASNPFEDPVAVNLEARAAQQKASVPAEKLSSGEADLDDI